MPFQVAVEEAGADGEADGSALGEGVRLVGATVYG